MNGELQNVIFAGCFTHSMDAKNRVTIPARWRASEVDEFYTIPSPQGDFLRVIPPNEMSRISEKVASNPNISERDRITWERGFYRRAQHVATDRQGRILLPEEQCRQVKLSGEVILFGANRIFEIWNPQCWEAAAAAQDQAYQAIAAQIGH